MKEFLNYHYWLNMRPEPMLPNHDKGVMVFFGLIVVATIAAYWLKKRPGQNPYRRIWASAFTLLVTNFFVGLVLMFFSFEMVPLLAARLWLLVWFAEVVLWVFFIIKDAQRVPAMIAKAQTEKELKKYIP